MDPVPQVNMSDYSCFGNNPIMYTDIKGDLKDWFQNSKSGDVYYNSSLTKGDEGKTSDMEGKGWEWMGSNGMFKNKEGLNTDMSVLYKNSSLTNDNVKNVSLYDKSPIFNDAKLTGIRTSAKFSGNNAKKFMSNMGYSYVPKIYEFKTDIRTQSFPEGFNKIDITDDNSEITKIYASQYVPNKGMVCNTTVLKGGTSIRVIAETHTTIETGTTKQMDVYTKGINVNWGTIWNTFDKVVDWKGAYSEMWEKIIKKTIKK